MIDIDTSKTLTVQHWLKALQISRNTFKKLLANGTIPPPLPLGDRCQRWPASDLETVLRRN